METANPREDGNFAYYERILKRSLDVVDRVLEEHPLVNRSQRVKLAAAIFDRYCADQMGLKQSKLQTQATVDAMTHLLEGRR